MKTDAMFTTMVSAEQAAVLEAYSVLREEFPNGQIRAAVIDLMDQFMDMMSYTPYTGEDLRPQIEFLHDLNKFFSHIERACRR